MFNKEILRIKLLNKIENIVKLNQTHNIHLTDLMIYESDKSEDPILSILTKSYGLPKDVVSHINLLVSQAITLLKNNNLSKKSNKSKPHNTESRLHKKQTHHHIILTYKTPLISLENATIKINMKAYKRIKRHVINESYKDRLSFDELLWILYYRYINLNLYNNSQGAVHPRYYNALHKKFGTETEGFGSFFNHTLKYYYGLFPDLEKYFGCLGNFFTSKLTKPFYVINPPFTIEQINLTIAHMLSELNKRPNLTILFVIPAWVNSDRVKLQKKCRRPIQLKKYKDKLDIDKLKKSAYMKEYLLYCQENFEYYDYLKEQNVKFAPSNLILLSNADKQSNKNPVLSSMETIFGKCDISIK